MLALSIRRRALCGCRSPTEIQTCGHPGRFRHPTVNRHPATSSAPSWYGAPRKGSADAGAVEDHLDELYRLADHGRRRGGRADLPAGRSAELNFYLGQGKVEELKGVLQQARSTLVLFDERVVTGAGTKLEEALSLRVMDRT